MMKKKIIILCLGFFLLSIAMLYAADDSKKINTQEPIEITSDRLDAYNEKKIAIFSGNAQVKQADWVLKTDRLTIYYKKQAGKKETIGVKEIEGTGDLEKIEAKGKVFFTQKMRIAQSDEAVYFHDSGQIVLTGNPSIRENKNKVAGCKITIYLKEDRGTVERCEGGKVVMEIHPEEKDLKKK